MNKMKIKSTIIVISLVLTTFVLAPQSTAHNGLRVSQTSVSTMWVLSDRYTECFAQSFYPATNQIDITRVDIWLDKGVSSYGNCVVGISQVKSKDFLNDWDEWEFKPIPWLENDWAYFTSLDMTVEEGTEYFIMALVYSSGNSMKVGVKQYSSYGDGKIWQWHTDNGGDGWIDYPEWDMAFKVYGNTSVKPDKPGVPSGPSSGETGQTLTYTTSTDDADGDQIRYRFDWDADGSHDYTGWSPLSDSGLPRNRFHAWSSPGTYVVKVQTRDALGALSVWSLGLTVVVSS